MAAVLSDLFTRAGLVAAKSYRLIMCISANLGVPPSRGPAASLPPASGPWLRWTRVWRATCRATIVRSQANVFGLVAVALVLPVAAAAQGRPEVAAAYARLDTLSQYYADVAMCERLGFAIDEPAIAVAQEKIVAEATAGGMDTLEAQSALQSKAESKLRRMQENLETMTADALHAKSMRADIVGVFARYVRRCEDATSDPIFSAVVHGLPAADAANIRQALIDRLVEPAGEASWQTPKIVARADLLAAVGVCKSELSAAEVERETAPFIGPGRADAVPQDRLAHYYSASYLAGIDNAESAHLTPAQCATLLAARHTKLAQAK